MPLVAAKGAYALKICYDEFPLNPREDYDNFGKMCCWHSRYSLGDEHNHAEPRDFMAKLVEDAVPDKDLIEYVKAGNVEEMRLYYDRHDRGWRLETYDDYFKQWFEDYFLDRPLSYEYECIVADVIRDNLPLRTLSELAERSHIILPLYLYDHSGITMSTSPFSCPWDSGQVGYTYASYEMVAREYGAVDEETLARATSLLESEVECYDYYLTGQCYGYEFYKDGAEVDSCWGFLGDLRDMHQEIEGWLPEECKGLTGDMDEAPESVDLADFWEQHEDETEEEMEDAR